MNGVLFLCRANSCRSQIAEGLARAELSPSVAVFSAGTRQTGVNPVAIEVMKEAGIDICGQRSKSVDEIPADRVDVVITLCAEGEEDCPFFPGAVTRMHWPIPDPAAATGNDAEIMAAFRNVRDDLKRRIKELAVGGTVGD